MFSVREDEGIMTLRLRYGVLPNFTREFDPDIDPSVDADLDNAVVRLQERRTFSRISFCGGNNVCHLQGRDCRCHHRRRRCRHRYDGGK